MKNTQFPGIYWGPAVYARVVMGTCGVWRTREQGREEETKGLNVKVPPCARHLLLLQIYSLFFTLHFRSLVFVDHVMAFPCEISGSQVIFISGQHWQETGGSKGGEWGQDIYNVVSLPAKLLQHTCMPSQKMLIKPLSPLTFSFRGDNTSTAP